MRRTPAYDAFDDRDEPQRDRPEGRRRSPTGPDDPAPPVITLPPGNVRPMRRADARPGNAPRRPPPRNGPDPRVWFVRGSLGVAALAGLWLGLQALFPVSETQVSQGPTPTAPIDAPAVGAPEPPTTAAQPAAQPAAPPVAPPVSQPTPEPEGDRLPGLPTPDPARAAQAAAPAQAAQPAQPPEQPAAEAASATQPDGQPAARPEGQPAQAEGQPAQAADQPPATAEAEPATAEAQPPAPAEPVAQAQPREESPAQQPVGTPTLAPIPPPANSQPSAPPARPAAPPPAPKPQPAAKPAAPPPAAASSGGAFQLSASASPANPISEQANVTITVRATQGGAPVAGANCMATIHYRTATARQPEGGFRTNANGVGSFVLDARGTTYGHHIPVDVTCTGRGGSATARTGFTPVRGR